MTRALRRSIVLTSTAALAAAHITIRQLANNTSGLFDYEERLDPAGPADPLRRWPARELLEMAVRDPKNPYSPPGTAYHYSNTGFVLLEMIIERVTGAPLGAEIERRIIAALRLRHTSYPTGPAIPGEHSHGYVPTRGTDALRDITALDPSIARGAGAMISTLADLEVWAEALADGRLLSPRMQRERLTWVNTRPGSAFQRYGGILYLGGFLGHNGEIYGYNSTMFHLPSRQATIIVLTNLMGEKSFADEMLGGFLEVLFPGIPPKATG